MRLTGKMWYNVSEQENILYHCYFFQTFVLIIQTPLTYDSEPSLKVVETCFLTQNDRNMQVYIGTYSNPKL